MGHKISNAVVPYILTLKLARASHRFPSFSSKPLGVPTAHIVPGLPSDEEVSTIAATCASSRLRPQKYLEVEDMREGQPKPKTRWRWRYEKLNGNH
jgi:hypothetical protein